MCLFSHFTIFLRACLRHTFPRPPTLPVNSSYSLMANIHALPISTNPFSLLPSSIPPTVDYIRQHVGFEEDLTRRRTDLEKAFISAQRKEKGGREGENGWREEFLVRTLTALLNCFQFAL